MPPPETSSRDQKAVLFVLTGASNNAGEPLVDTDNPVELDVRWVQKRSSTMDPDGNTVTLDATVVVDREIAIDSIMWRGDLDSWLGTGTAGDDTEYMQVKTYREVPDIKGRNIRRVVGLKKYKDQLPEA